LGKVASVVEASVLILDLSGQTGQVMAIDLAARNYI